MQQQQRQFHLPSRTLACNRNSITNVKLDDLVTTIAPKLSDHITFEIRSESLHIKRICFRGFTSDDNQL